MATAVRRGRYIMIGWGGMLLGAVVVATLWASTMLLVTALFGDPSAESHQ
ncbi:MAG: hypothetical protein ACI39C_11970 [Dietzia sp.]